MMSSQVQHFVTDKVKNRFGSKAAFATQNHPGSSYQLRIAEISWTVPLILPSASFQALIKAQFADNRLDER